MQSRQLHDVETTRHFLPSENSFYQIKQEEEHDPAAACMAEKLAKMLST